MRQLCIESAGQGQHRARYNCLRFWQFSRLLLPVHRTMRMRRFCVVAIRGRSHSWSQILTSLRKIEFEGWRRQRHAGFHPQPCVAEIKSTAAASTEKRLGQMQSTLFGRGAPAEMEELHACAANSMSLSVQPLSCKFVSDESFCETRFRRPRGFKIQD